MKFLIVANGPFLPKSHIESLIQPEITVVALDGAADKLAERNIFFHVIVGDLDSLIGTHDTTIVHIPDQNSTDLQKGIVYADSCGATAIDITCATEGRMDHSLGNIRFLRRFYNPHRPIRIYTETQILEFVKDNTVTVKGNTGDYCGIMAFPKASMSTRGLKYDTNLISENDTYELDFGFAESTSNEFAAKEARITIRGEALVITPRLLHPHPTLSR